MSIARLSKARLALFYAAGGFGFFVENLIMSLGLGVLLTVALTGFDATSFAGFVNLLIDHFLAAERAARIEFIGGVVFALTITFIFISTLRGPAQLRRLRQDARSRFIDTLHRAMPHPTNDAQRESAS